MKLEKWYHDKWPKLAADFENNGDPALKAKHEAIGKEMAPIRRALETYDEERERGLIHNPGYHTKMAEYRQKLAQLEKDCVKACDAWRATCPEYDPDNYINSCGCVIVDGKSAYWCGDHY